MRIAIFSDPHLGFGYGTERYEDAFDAFKEALELSKGCDLLLITGDLFNSKAPTTDSLSRAMELLLDLRMSDNGARLVEGINRRISHLSPVNTMGLPVIALHGNHERRAKGLVNSVQALEKAGLLIYVHCNGLVFEKEGERVSIQGMSAVPDQYAKDVLKQWNPQPLTAAFNILMLHQIFSEFFQSPHSISASILPQGFDLYIDGDIHRPRKAAYKDKPFIVSGSLIPTQQNKDETDPKGVWILNTSSGSIDFHPLQKQRKFYFLEYEKPDRQLIENDLEAILTKSHEKKPAIRVRILEDFEWQAEFESKYADRALISFRKRADTKAIEGVSLTEHMASVEETASRLLRENLQKANLRPQDFEHIFELLTEKRQEEALNLIQDAVRKQKAQKPQQKQEKRGPHTKGKTEPRETKKETGTLADYTRS